MRILLINPPRSPHNSIFDHAPDEAKPFIHRKLIGPPLGLLTVAAAVRDHDVALLEMKAEYDLHPDAPPPEKMAAQWVADFKPDIVGITVIASEFPAAMRLLGEIKRIEPSILTVAGGLHATLCPHDFAGGPADVVCLGQAAHAFRSIAAARESGRTLAGVEGLYLNSPGGFISTGGNGYALEPAGRDFVLPDRSFVKRWLSTYVVGGKHGPATYLFSSLGCPYRCTFCSIWPQFGGAFHQRHPDSIVQELKRLDDYPVVRFADANTVVDAAFITDLFDRIMAEGIRKDYIMDIRVDTAARNPALIGLLARAGLKVVIAGFESHRSNELKLYNKGTDEQQIKLAVEILHDNGIQIRGNYVVPPDYTEKDFAALAAYAARYPVAYAGYTILTPMPGTVFHDRSRRDIVDTDLSKYNFFNPVLRTKLPREKFCEMVGGLWTIKKGADVI